MKKLLIFLFALIFSASIFAQDTIKESIYIPDRPGYTANANLIGLHQMDIEMGFGYNYVNCGDVNNIFYNTTYFRYGIFKHLEIRAGIDFGEISTQLN